MRLLKPVLLIITFFFCLCFTTCGLEDYFYLPEIYDGQSTAFDVTISLPSVNTSVFYYAEKFSIYYKIYLSNANDTATINTTAQLSAINPQLYSDYDFFYKFIDITKTDIPTSSNFSSRQYYELQFENNSDLLKVSSVSGKNLYIHFIPRDHAIIRINDEPEVKILRYGSGNFSLSPNQDFLSTDDLRSNDTAGAINTSSKLHNWDIYPESSSATGTAEHAYISMFIVIQGNHPTNFSRIFSRLTHLGVFQLQKL